MKTENTRNETSFREKIIDFLTLEPHILALFGAIFLINLGEQMWSEFFSLYFESLGGTVFALGVFKSVSDTLDATLQLPGGVLSDKWGRLNAGIAFIVFGIGGYLIYAVAPSWQFLFVGLVLVQGTSSLLQPTIFAIIGDSIPPEKRTNAFSVQSILKRLPIVVAPMIGGFIFNAMGIFEGVRISLWATIAIGFVAVGILYYVKQRIPEHQRESKDAESEGDLLGPEADDGFDGLDDEGAIPTVEILDDVSETDLEIGTDNDRLPKKLRPLLTADIFARFGQAMVKSLLILHVATVASLEIVGVLIGFQMTVAILSYMPAASIAERVGKKPVVMVTFLCFSIYPIAIIASQTISMLAIGYFLAGFREFGEPSRKAMIVDRTHQETRGENVGLYYTLRSFSIVPASIIGAALWIISPMIAGAVAGIVSFTGLAVFSIFVRDGDTYE